MGLGGRLVELSDDEWVVLAALVRRLVHADHELTPAELDVVAELERLAGPGRWNLAVRTARRTLTDAATLDRAVQTRIRPHLRPVVYTLLVDLAGADGIASAEGEVLRWIAGEWGLR